MNYYLETSAGEASVRYELSSSQALVVQARAGEQYRVVSRHGELPDNVVAIRTDTDLAVRLDNGVHLVIEDYYVVCRNDFCGISLSEEGVPVSANNDADRLFTGDNTIVYSRGSLEGIVLLDLLGSGFVHEPPEETAQPEPSTVDDTTDDRLMFKGDGEGIAPLQMMSLSGAGLGLIAATAASGSSGGDSSVPPDNQGPVFTSGSTATVDENQTAAYTAEATDSEGDRLTYRLEGADAALFTIDADTGVVSFSNAPDYEAPGDADGDNDYDITVIATDSDDLSARQDVTVSVRDVNEAPVFISGSTATVDENQTAAYTAEATDPEGDRLTYRLDGADAALFTIDADTGVVSFRSAPDYENPGDADGDNDYEITVTATEDSDGLSTSQDVTISVNDVLDVIALSDVQWDNTDLGFVMSNGEYRHFNILNVSNIGDVNGDGFDDLVIGAPLANSPELPPHPNGSDAYDSDSPFVDFGAVYLVFGKADGGNLELPVSDIQNNHSPDIVVIEGLKKGRTLGAFTGNVGDINGDGFDDILITSTTPFHDGNDPARAYVIYGGRDLSDIDLSRIENPTTPEDRSLGFVVKGRLGHRMSGAGDINGDGFDDLYISTSGNTRSYVIYGGSNLPNMEISNSEIVSGDNNTVVHHTVVNGPNRHFRTGGIVGDLNGDGLNDMVFSEVYEVDRQGVTEYTRELFVVFGGNNLPDIEFSEIAAGNGGFRITGLRSTNSLQIRSAGDVNGDGFDDLIISDSNANGPNGDRSGVSYVVFGGSNLSKIEIGEVERGIGGFALYGAGENDRSGRHIRSVGDINGDGLGDLLISNSEHGSSRGTTSLDHYVVYGKTDTDSVELADLEQGVGGFVIRAPYGGLGHGMDVSPAGDINGDGFDDLVIGSAPLDYLGTNPTPTPGLTHVIYGGQDVSANALVGTSGDDVLVGSSHADHIIGGQGDDILIGNGGADVLRGGAGDDILAISDLAFVSLDGGSGIDTLRFDAPLTLNFSAFRNRITDVEKVDLRADGGDSHLILSDVLNLNDVDASTGDRTLSIHGSNGDTVTLLKGHQSGQWERSVDGSETDTWTFRLGGPGGEILATVLVDDSIHVTAPI